MVTGDGRADDTLTESSIRERLPALWLIYIGSAEDDFAHAGSVFRIDDVRKVRFGRGSALEAVRETGSSLHVTVPLAWVSRAHAELQCVHRDSLETTQGRIHVELRDLASRNGTMVDGAPLREPVRLTDGRIFEVGRSFWCLRYARDKQLLPHPHADLLPTGTANPRLAAALDNLQRLATSDVPLLLQGETGTGKETLARELAKRSGRAPEPIAASLAALDAERAESLLFGRGDEPGLLERARGGTLFLDDVDELSPELQAKLLVALDRGRTTRLGATAEGTGDVRLISAANADLHRRVLDGAFRGDLYGRLAGFEARLPPLRDRREDLGMLVRQLAGGTRLTTRAFRRLVDHHWWFNLRELAQTLGTAHILGGTGGAVDAEIFDEIIARRGDVPPDADKVHALRRELIGHLVRSGGDTAQVAEAMGRDRKDIHRWLERFELEPERYRRH